MIKKIAFLFFFLLFFLSSSKNIEGTDLTKNLLVLNDPVIPDEQTSFEIIKANSFKLTEETITALTRQENDF